MRSRHASTPARRAGRPRTQPVAQGFQFRFFSRTAAANPAAKPENEHVSAGNVGGPFTGPRWYPSAAASRNRAGARTMLGSETAGICRYAWVSHESGSILYDDVTDYSGGNWALPSADMLSYRAVRGQCGDQAKRDRAEDQGVPGGRRTPAGGRTLASARQAAESRWIGSAQPLRICWPQPAELPGGGCPAAGRMASSYPWQVRSNDHEHHDHEHDDHEHGQHDQGTCTTAMCTMRAVRSHTARPPRRPRTRCWLPCSPRRSRATCCATRVTRATGQCWSSRTRSARRRSRPMASSWRPASTASQLPDRRGGHRSSPARTWHPVA